jgi:hypothetical protein
MYWLPRLEQGCSDDVAALLKGDAARFSAGFRLPPADRFTPADPDLALNLLDGRYPSLAIFRLNKVTSAMLSGSWPEFQLLAGLKVEKNARRKQLKSLRRNLECHMNVARWPVRME